MASDNDFGGNNQLPLSIEYYKQSDQRCGICNKLARDPLIANKCCNQIFCSKCLKEYLKDTEDDYTMPCPHCKTKGFTYIPLDMKVRINIYIYTLYPV